MSFAGNPWKSCKKSFPKSSLKRDAMLFFPGQSWRPCKRFTVWYSNSLRIRKSPVLIGKFFELSQPWLPHPRFTQAPKLLPGLSRATCQTSWTKKRFQKFACQNNIMMLFSNSSQLMEADGRWCGLKLNSWLILTGEYGGGKRRKTAFLRDVTNK